MHQYLTEAISVSHNTPINSQMILTDFKLTMEKVLTRGFEYDKIFTFGRWEFKVGQAISQGLFPTVYHALFNPEGF